MNILTTERFTEKFRTLDSLMQRRVMSHLKSLEAMNVGDVSKKLSVVNLLDAQDQVFVLRVDPQIRIFFTFSESNAEESIVLLDVVIRLAQQASRVTPPSLKNPRLNSALNPSLNSAINPNMNSAINPVLNSRLNPILNSVINPILNSTINPVLNSTINPVLNSTINPTLNSSLNPRLNYSINPRLNPTYDGPYLYKLDLEEVGFAVRANDRVLLVFDNDLNFSMLGVKNNIQGYCLFDRQNDWIGHLVPNGQGGYNQFSKSNEWVGFMI